MKKVYLLFSLFFLILACQQVEKLDETLLLGKWKGTEWKVKGEERVRDASLVQFEFKTANTYGANFGTEAETGNYRLAGNKLYTTETGKAEKMVALSKLTKDSIVIEMNRVGTLETLILIKE